MKFNLFILAFILLSPACNLFSQNLIDANGRKQGNWEYKKTDTILHTSLYLNGKFNSENYSETVYENYFILSGIYENGKKYGVWKSFNPKPNQLNYILSEIEFKEDEVMGKVKIFYKNGNLKLEGIATENSDKVKMKLYSDIGKFWGYRNYSKSEIIDLFTNFNLIKN